MTTTPRYEPPPNGWRTFVIVWITQSISVFGSALTFFAITIWLTQTLYPRPEQKPELAFALSAISLSFALPSLFMAPIAGAWADRHDRKRTMIAMDLANAGLSLIMLALIATNTLQIWTLLVLMVLFATVGSFHGAAFDTSYAMLVPEKQLPRANGMMQTIWALSGILSPAIAATIIALPRLAQQGIVPGSAGAWLAQLSDGTVLAIAIDAITFLAAAITLLFLTIPSPARTDRGKGAAESKSIWADVREGGAYIWHRRSLLWLLGTFTVANFVGAPMGVFQPLIIKFNLAADWAARGFTFETALAMLGSIGSFGGVAGGVLISLWGGLKASRIFGVLGAMIVAGIAQIIFGLSPLIYLSAAMLFLIDAMLPIMNAHSQAIWQAQTPHELQGRVFAVRRVTAQFTWPMGAALAGPLGGLLDPGLVLAALGAFMTLFCAAQLFNPYLRRVEDKAWLDELAAQRTSAVQ